MTLKKYYLDSRAIDWIEEVFTCNTSLSRFLSDSLPLRSGKIWTYAPVNVHEGSLYNFSEGGLLGRLLLKRKSMTSVSGEKYVLEEIPDCSEELTSYLFDLFQTGTIDSCLFEDVMARANDLDIQERFSDSARFVGNEVYHVLEKSNVSECGINKIICAVNLSWHFLCVGSNEAMDFKSLQGENLKWYATKVKLLVVGAYDGESFVFWEPS